MIAIVQARQASQNKNHCVQVCYKIQKEHWYNDVLESYIQCTQDYKLSSFTTTTIYMTIKYLTEPYKL